MTSANESAPQAPWLSIVTINFNNSSGLVQTLESVRSQQSPLLFEHIVVDGASTDGSAELAQHYQETTANAVSIVEKDDGIYDAMNKGARLATGNFLLFLNSGDTLDNLHVVDELHRAHLRAISSRTAAPWIVGQVRHGSIPTPLGIPFDMNRFWRGSQSYNHQSTLFDRRTFWELGGYELDAGFAADVKLMMRFGLRAAPLESETVIAHYDGQGVSSALVQNMPLVFHAYRKELLRLRLVRSALSSGWAVSQLIRRRGLVQGVRIARQRIHDPARW